MRYYSTNHQTPKVSFKEAMIRSEAPDGGLYMPERLPVLPNAFINNIRWMSLKDISYVITNTLFGDDMPASQLKSICDEAATFPMPIYEIEHGIYVMELFHGPTKTVKDFSSQILTRILQHLHDTRVAHMNVLVATTGNTGNAIAKGFNDMSDVNVYVLYPKGTSSLHFDHINGVSGNIHPIEVSGTIDDCREMIGRAFNDPELNESMVITSANSLNIGSLLPATIPFFHAYSQLTNKHDQLSDLYVSVPSGNCGNLLAGYIARKMGLPISRLVAACNENAAFSNFLRTGESPRKRSVRTYAYGMDMPYTVNANRFLELCNGDMDTLRADIVAEVCSDKDIARTINKVYHDTGYLLDPHGAVAYIGLKRQLPKGATGVFFATSHPSKSIDILDKINDGGLKLPYKLTAKNYCSRPEAVIPPTYGAFKKLLKYYNDQSVSQRFA